MLALADFFRRWFISLIKQAKKEPYFANYFYSFGKQTQNTVLISTLFGYTTNEMCDNMLRRGIKVNL
jgi:hypothetical protein